MSNIEVILARIEKANRIQQDKQRVELAMFKSVQEITKMYDDLKAVRDEANKYKRQLQDAAIGLGNSVKSLNIRTTEFITEANKTITEAKALGLEAPKSLTDLPKFAKDFQDYAKLGLKVVDQVNSGTKSF